MSCVHIPVSCVHILTGVSKPRESDFRIDCLATIRFHSFHASDTAATASESWSHSNICVATPFAKHRRLEPLCSLFLIQAVIEPLRRTDACSCCSLQDKKAQEGWKFHRTERSSSWVRRSLRLPEHADLAKVTAKYADGVLHISVRLPRVVALFTFLKFREHADRPGCPP